MMPVYQLGDLVVPNMGHPYNVHEDNPEAIGLILQMRAMTPQKPEAKILWNDVPGGAHWTFLSEVQPVKP
jgi:hypothetical protein